jgi:predicted permease
MVLRKIAIVLYGVGLLANFWLMAVSFSANAHLPWEWRVDYIAASFIPMALLMLGVLYSQAKTQAVSWPLVPIVLIASISLFYSLVLHGFPEKSKLFALGHLIFVVGALAWMFFWPTHIGQRRE